MYYKRIEGFLDREPLDNEILRDLEEEVARFDESLFSSEEADTDISLTDFKAVASYSWSDQNRSQILVPGHPKIWLNKLPPFTVERDIGRTYVDQNGAELQSSPLLPTFIAIRECANDFKFGGMDFITDRNGLRKLHRWANKTSWSRKALQQAFRIDVELVGRTILFQRWEVESTQMDAPGYERRYHEHTTASARGCEMATGHRRIMTFRFGGLNILTRSMIDACLPGPLVENPTTVDRLTEDLEQLEVSQKIATLQGNFLSVSKAGKLVPQESVIELKTRNPTPRNKLYWSDVYVQMFFSQIPRVFTGIHKRGTFVKIEEKTLEEVKAKANDPEMGLRRLRKLLGIIQNTVLANAANGDSLSIIFHEELGDQLTIRRRNRESGLLPSQIIDMILE